MSAKKSSSLPIGQGVCGNCNDPARRPLYTNPLGGKPVCGGCAKELREAAASPKLPLPTKPIGLRTKATGRCVHAVWEPGDMTRYEAILTAVGGRAHLILLSPDKGAMGLPDYWRTSLSDFYVAEKLNVNDHTARAIVTAIEAGLFDVDPPKVPTSVVCEHKWVSDAPCPLCTAKAPPSDPKPEDMVCIRCEDDGWVYDEDEDPVPCSCPAGERYRAEQDAKAKAGKQ